MNPPLALQELGAGERGGLDREELAADARGGSGGEGDGGGGAAAEDPASAPLRLLSHCSLESKNREIERIF